MANNDKVDNRVCLIVIDGWGNSSEEHGNAIHHAKTPVMDQLCSGNWKQIEAHGMHVGLPEGLMGNSEVGHLNIGAGRVIYQDIVRINLDIKNKKIIENVNLNVAVNRAKSENGRIHLAGLVSDGGVHSHMDHMFELVKTIKSLGVPELFIHCFADGRDTSPTSGAGFLQTTVDFLQKENYGELATIVGRYYAMDRDKRWERVRVAYDAMIGGVGEHIEVKDAVTGVKQRYEAGETDEFLKPFVFSKQSRIQESDTVIFFNYRADRMREITECVGMKRYEDLKSNVPHPANLELFGMTQYKTEFSFKSLYPPQGHKNVLAEWLSAQGVSQYHCAETEKYAHVTFFFNGGVEKSFENEERMMVPSPKVATYDLDPPMSSAGVADKMVEEIAAKKHPFIMCNFAPPDMVGHTGVYQAAVKACEATDIAIGRIYEACKKYGYIMMVTSDHGNAEKMIAPDGGKHTAHTCNTVPFTCSSDHFKFKESLSERKMALCDVAPSVLYVMGLPVPPEMGGLSILERV